MNNFMPFRVEVLDSIVKDLNVCHLIVYTVCGNVMSCTINSDDSQYGKYYFLCKYSGEIKVDPSEVLLYLPVYKRVKNDIWR